MLPVFATWLRRDRPPQPLIAALPRTTLEWEIDRLPPRSFLLQQGPFDVIAARSSQVPALLLEVGRVRELTFRAVGEGTGASHDLDRFDEHYDHLILWDRERREVAGGYRLVRVPDALRQGGLYTATLFHLNPRLFADLGPALELGRSFVHPEYQRKPLSLLLLWKGIGRYLERHPECQVLFGPVSISSGYSDRARYALSDYFRREAAADELLRRHVKAKRPVCARWSGEPAGTVRVQSLEEVDALVKSIGGAAAERGIPVLLRQYLKLGGRVLECSVDPAFGGCLDALVVVDLRRVDRQRLNRMLGMPLSARGGDCIPNRNAGSVEGSAVGLVEV